MLARFFEGGNRGRGAEDYGLRLEKSWALSTKSWRSRKPARHTDYEEAARLLDGRADRQLVMLTNQSVKDLLDARYQKFRNMGQYFDIG